MIRLFIIGLWICIVAFGSLIFGIRMNFGGSGTPDNEGEVQRNLSHEHADQISVPVIVDGGVTGYVVAQLDYIVDSNIKNQISVPVGLYINDEIFRVFFGAYSDTRQIEKVKFDDVRQKIIDGVNQRLSAPVLMDLLVEQFSFIPVEQIRR